MIRLSDFSTKAPENLTKKSIKKETDLLARQLGQLQHLLYAESKRSLLVVFQGMDASGKDGATRKVFKYCSPTGVWAYSFKKPTEVEMDHDFLWRVHKLTPRKGKIQIFNRSHYEDILIQRVHKWIDEEKVHKRMAAINQFENLLTFDNDTIIVKFYMHISPERQKEKLQERIDDPTKQWKHNANDWKEAERWEDYMQCYEYVLNESDIPWNIIPVDQRWYRDYCVAKKLVNVLQSLNMKLPGIETD